MKYSNFIKKYIGVKIDFDGLYNTQCVDTIDQYINDVLALNIGFYGNAKEWWLQRNNKWLTAHFKAVDPFKKKIQTGDIGIRASGKYGHIFLIDNYDDHTNTITIYDTNGTGNNDPLTKRKITLCSQYITGILRPIDQTNIDKAVNQMALINSPCTLFKTNAYVNKQTNVFSDNTKTLKVGCIQKNEKVKLLATGEKNSIIQYGVDNDKYKVGIISTSNIVKI